MSWTPCRRSCRCRPWRPTALCGAPPSAETAGSEEWTHLRTRHRSNSAGRVAKVVEEKKQRDKFLPNGQLSANKWWVSCLIGQPTNLLLFVQHDMRFEAGDAGEPFIANGAREVRGCVCGLVECEVEIHVKCLWAMVTSMRLQGREEKLKKVVNNVNGRDLRCLPMQLCPC